MSDSQERRVYVGNLPYEVRWPQLKDFMRQAGEVLYADVKMTPNGMSRGCGIVEYATVEQARTAIETLNNTDLSGRPVFVREDREVPHPANAAPRQSPAHSLFFANLPFTMNWYQLKELASSAGKVERAVVHSNSGGRSKGHGNVSFETAEDAARAVELLNGKDINGRIIEVRPDLPMGQRPSKFGARGQNGASPSGADRAFSAGASSGSAAPGIAGAASGAIPGAVPGAIPGAVPGASSGAIPGIAAPHGQAQISSVFGAVSGSRDPSEVIYVSNLPWNTTNMDLIELFRTAGPVVQAEIQFMPDGRPAGTGVVKFQTTEVAQLAISQLDGYRYGGSDLLITFARFAPPAV